MAGGVFRDLIPSERDSASKERDWFDFGWGDDEPVATVGSAFSAPLEADAARSRDIASAPTLNFLEGFAGSAFTGMAELFGFDAPSSVQRWRDENPMADLASQLAGIAVPYAGAFKLSQAPRAARLLEGATEGTLKAFGSTSARSPVVGGALKEFYRYTPLELGRLGTGWAVDADMGDMFADVALSQVIAGSLGGIGGFLRAGGTAAAKAGKIAEAPQGLLPTFEYRMARTPGSTIMGDVDPEQFVFQKKQEALRYVPESSPNGIKGQYVFSLDGATPESGSFLESLFKPNPSNAKATTIAARPFDVRQLHSDGKAWSVGTGVGDQVAKQAGFADLDDLAETVVYPRLVKVQGDARTVGSFGPKWKQLVDSGALKQVADDTWMGQEDGGLWVVMKRVARGAEPPRVEGQRRGAFQFGPMKVRSGDEFLLGKTDKPGKFAPEAHKINQATMEKWAQLKDPYRQLATLNPYGQEMNLIQSLLDPHDWVAARQLRRTGWQAQVAPKLAAKIKAATGTADQAYIEQLSARLYDVAAPKAFKMGKNPVFGRFYSLLEGTMRFADETLNRVMQGEVRSTGSLSGALRGKDVTFAPHDGYRPVREIVAELDEVERQQLVQISNAQMPMEALEEAAETVSPKVLNAAKELQAINRHILDKYVLPALEEAGMAGEFKWLEGYIMPRLYKGDFFVRVTDEAGKPKFIANGVTPKEAETMARAVVDEAASVGQKWKTEKFESYAFKGTAGEEDNLEAVYKMVHEQMGQSGEAQALVQKAMRRLLAEKTAKPLPGRAPKTLTTERTGIPGAPDVIHHSLDDVIKASENHYRQLLRYAGFHSWKYRFGQQAQKWGKGAEIEYTDLMRKATQWLGVEGQLTNTMNRLLQPVLGNVLGGKAATRIAQGTNALMYAWNLGIMNPTFAVLNLLTPLQTVAPWVAFMQKAPSEELARITQQTLVVGEDGLVRGNRAMLSPLKVLRESVGLMRNPTADLRSFFDQAVIDGTLSPQTYDAWVGSAARNVHNLRDAWGRGGWEFIKESATLLSTRSEQFSRLVAFNSAYIVGKSGFGLAGDGLYRFMRKGVETTMYGYGVMDRSRILTGPVGSMWGLFKNWQFHFIGSMAQYSGLAMKDGIWAPMLWQGGAALSLGGIGATPLVLLADGLAKWASDSPDSFSYLQDNWEGPAGDAVYFGLPSLLGISLQASSTIPGTDVTQDVKNLTNAVMWERAVAAGKAIGGAADLWEGTGENPLKNPNVVDQLMQAFAPRAFFRAFSAMEGDYVKSMSTGYPTVRDLPLSTRVLHGIGFNPTEIEKNYIAGEQLYKRQQAERDAIQDLGTTYAQARLVGDLHAMDSAVRRAITSGVDVQSMLKSADTRYRRETQGDFLSRFDKAEQARVRGWLED